MCRIQRRSGRRRWSLPPVDWGLVFSGGIRESLEDQLLSSRVIGGSSSTVFAWDLRWQQQPIVLYGVAAGEFQSHSLSESEIWEVQYDSYSSNIGNMSKSRVLPVMICSEYGILAVVEHGEEPIELLTLTDRTPR
ncbi:nuclear pore complex protein NUP43-like [Camellia sinensis]|uniref:nuclear pore complex protein NUP43-like n=1 Tax=Camellia sinensis TaxID=4442 RepID=UPI001035884E|nr:nuclear pore complex protein NUP43-like [Camellia sinensis]